MSPEQIRRTWDDDDQPRSVFPEPLTERLTRENAALRQGLWDTWAALGYDTDGDTGPGAWIACSGVSNFIATVVKDAAEFRRQQEDDYDADTSLTRGMLLTDQAQLAALPPRCVVRAADGTIAARFDQHLGVVFGDDRPFQWSVLSVPALVLWVDGDTLALPGQASVEAQR